MGSGWNLFGFPLFWVFFVVLIFHLKIQVCGSLNLEGIALLEFRGRVDSDPYDALSNWDPNDDSPCMWSGVLCHNNEVHMLDLSRLDLGGSLAPEIGKLSNIRALILYRNNFSGVIPREIRELTNLEYLDLSHNKLTGHIPTEIGNMPSLKHLLLCNNSFECGLPPELIKLSMPLESEVDPTLPSDCNFRSNWMTSKRRMRVVKRLLDGNEDIPLRIQGDGEPCEVQRLTHLLTTRRKLLQSAVNLPAASSSGGQPSPAGPFSLSSGSVPATGNGNGINEQPTVPSSSPSPSSPSTTPSNSSDAPPSSASNRGTGHHYQMPSKWLYSVALPAVAIILIICLALLLMCQSPGVATIGPWKTGLSGQLQKAFVMGELSCHMSKRVGVTCIIKSQHFIDSNQRKTLALLLMCQSPGVATIGPWKTGLSGQLQKAFVMGAPKLNRAELETASEEFSNIIGTMEDFIIYKGTLSSGVEIAVTSTTAASSEHWSKCSELYFRKKIDVLSRLNHKNFVNLLGYCIEDEPFTRMMVFEYASNGTLSEHLHGKEVEHLDWNSRMRIIMGLAYCLQYMHHDMSPPVAHPNLNSSSIYLMDDFAAKLADFSYCKGLTEKTKQGDDDDVDRMNSRYADMDGNIYSFGILLLEIISGKRPFSEEQGFLVNWAVDYLNDKRSISYMIDPTLNSFKNNELDMICEVIQQCIHPDTKQRSTMKEVTAKLKEVLAISPEAAAPRLSPLWWAELEILSVEAS